MSQATVYGTLLLINIISIKGVLKQNLSKERITMNTAKTSRLLLFNCYLRPALCWNRAKGFSSLIPPLQRRTRTTPSAIVIGVDMYGVGTNRLTMLIERYGVESKVGTVIGFRDMKIVS